MNTLRQTLCCATQRRAYVTARPFVPVTQLQNIDQRFGPRRTGPANINSPSASGGNGGARRRRKTRSEEVEDLEVMYGNSTRVAEKAAPSSPAFYTGRAIYYDQVIQLRSAIAHARSALKMLQLLPLPDFARESLPPLRPVWKNQQEMMADFQSKMTTSRYRKVTNLLNELNDYLRIAMTAGCTDLAAAIGQVVNMFESGKKDAFLARGKRKKIILDSYGRSYTLGKRKTSSARVWMIPVQVNQAKANPKPGEPESIDEMFGIAEHTPNMTTPITAILVNNIPLAQYFPLPVDRERVVRPLKVAGVIGAYNIFALTRGGGTTGQSGALAHGIARGLVAHEPDLEVLLRRGMFEFVNKFGFPLITFQPNSCAAILAWLNARKLEWLRPERG